MRSMTNKLFMALLLTSVLSNLTIAQKVSYPLKFFTFNNSRVSVGLGTEISIDNEGQGKSLMYWYRGNSDNIGIRNSDSIPYVAWKFVLDFSSPNSILSISSGLNYSYLKFTLVDKNNINSFDEYDIDCIDIPAYLKLTFGSREARNHFFINLGGIYSIPVSVKRKYSILANNEVDKNKTQLTGNNWIPSAMGGLNIYMGRKDKITNTYVDNWRIMLFAKFDYRTKSLINSNYENFTSTSFIDNNYKFKDFRLALGLSLNFALH